MFRLMRAGSQPGRPAPIVRIVAALIVLGMLIAAVPLLGRLVVWLTALVW